MQDSSNKKPHELFQSKTSLEDSMVQGNEGTKHVLILSSFPLLLEAYFYKELGLLEISSMMGIYEGKETPMGTWVVCLLA